MPDRYKDEEIENRTQSLCLFDVVGITVLNRCSNCPGATRTPLQHRRCPRELLQPNIFRPADSDCKISAALKSLASSSKQHESGHHEADTVLPDGLARLSLADSDGTAGTFGRSDSDLDIPVGRPELSGTPRKSHGVKRKSELEDREDKYKHLSVQDYLKLRPQKLFTDLEPGNQFIPGCWRVPSVSPMDTQEDRPSGEASSSRLFVAGFGIGLCGSGIVACNDGIETEGCERLADLEEMQF